VEKYAALFIVIPVIVIVVNVASAALNTHRAANKQVMTEGILGEAEILGYDLIGRKNYVDYRFKPEDRDEFVFCRRCLNYVPFAGFKEFDVGTLVPVRYLAKYPTISLLVPYARYQCAT
jgi:hypothetical protein